MEQVILDEKYTLDRILAKGGLGMIYRGTNKENGQPVAIKIIQMKALQGSLIEETTVLKALQGIEGIPTLYWDGYRNGRYFTVMELLGKDLHKKYHGKCSVRDVSIIAQQVLKTLECIHDKGYLHLDLKTGNLMVGNTNPNAIYTVDFGGATKYLDENGDHIEHSEKFEFKCFTYLFATSNMLKEKSPSRKDDMLLFGYVLLDLLSSLPWNSDDDDDSMIQKRLDLCGPLREKVFGHLPKQFYQYIDYCEKLEYKQRPDYEHLRSLFQDMFTEQGFHGEGILSENLEEKKNN